MMGYQVDITRRFHCPMPDLFEELVDQLSEAFFDNGETSAATYHRATQTFTFHIGLPPLLDRRTAVVLAWRQVDGVMQGLRLPPGVKHFGTEAITVIPPGGDLPSSGTPHDTVLESPS